MSERARLEWKQDLLFEGDIAGRKLLLDGDRQAGCSPMEAVMLSVAGCMAIDIVHILGKMRAELKSVAVDIEADRAPSDPKYFTRIRMRFEVRGDKVDATAVERAISLSREKYCSVYHSLRSDLELETTYAILP